MKDFWIRDDYIAVGKLCQGLKKNSPIYSPISHISSPLL